MELFVAMTERCLSSLKMVTMPKHVGVKLYKK